MPYEGKIEHDDVTCKPYSQGKELVFGNNAGQQLIVAMSLCSLMYNKIQVLISANGLIQIINIQVCLN